MKRTFLTMSLLCISWIVCAAPKAVNINQATAKQLTRLPGIGKHRAQTIIHFRQTHGKFKTPKSLQRVPGIGKKTVTHLSAHHLIMVDKISAQPSSDKPKTRHHWLSKLF